jgi:hypothetical protein
MPATTIRACGLLLGLALTPACHDAGVFHCQTNGECAMDAIAGLCQPTGYCSFPADDCASRQRYGDYAPPDLAGACVPIPGESGGVESADASGGSESGTPEPAGSDDGETDPDPTAATSSGVDAGSESGAVDGGDTGADTNATTPTGCGNGIVEGTEACDGSDFGGLSCADFAFPDGELGCDAACGAVDAGGCGGCGEAITAPGDDVCPEQCDDCQGNVCLILCTAPGVCSGGTLECPDGWDCSVTCSGDQACFGAAIDGPEVHRLSVMCEGVRACENAIVQCGLGLCEVSCGIELDVCNDTEHYCGNQACTTTCAGSGEDEGPDTYCGSACSCTECDD